MRTWIKTLLVFYFVVLLQHLCFAQNTDIKGAKDHPLVPRLENYSIQNYEEHRFDFENFKTENGSVRIEGHKYVIDYRLPSVLTPKGKKSILESYQTKLKSPQTNQLLNGPYYSVFKIESLKTETWVKVDPLNTNGERYLITIVEKEMMLQEVAPNAPNAGFHHAKDAEGSKDYPTLSRMPDFYIGRCEETEQASETFKTSKGDIKTEGNKFYIDYYLEEGKTPPGKIQILNNYRSVMLDAGAEVLLYGAYYDVYKIKKNGGETWIKIDPGVYDGKRYEVTIVEKLGITDLPNDTIEVIQTESLVMTGLSSSDRRIMTATLVMTGLNAVDRTIRTNQLEMTGLGVKDRIIKSSELMMTGLDAEDRIIKTEKLTMTGLNQ